MGKQHNKVEKRIRRKSYLKRKTEAVKAQIALGKKPSSKRVAKEAASDGSEEAAEAPKKVAAKKAPAKKAAAKKAPAKKVASKKVVEAPAVESPAADE